jgi:hypothetical protein
MNALWRLVARAALLSALCLLVACSSSRPVIWQSVAAPVDLSEENFMALVDAEAVDPVVATARVSLAECAGMGAVQVQVQGIDVDIILQDAAAQLLQQLTAKGANAYAVQSAAWESDRGESPQWRVLLQVQALICSA